MRCVQRAFWLPEVLSWEEEAVDRMEATWLRWKPTVLRRRRPKIGSPAGKAGQGFSWLGWRWSRSLVHLQGLLPKPALSGEQEVEESWTPLL